MCLYRDEEKKVKIFLIGFTKHFMIVALLSSISLFVPNVVEAQQGTNPNVCNCKGFSGPGGPCYAGPGGAAYDGPGGPAYSGPGGPCYGGPGGPEYSGPGGPASTAPGGLGLVVQAGRPMTVPVALHIADPEASVMQVLVALVTRAPEVLGSLVQQSASDEY